MNGTGPAQRVGGEPESFQARDLERRDAICFALVRPRPRLVPAKLARDGRPRSCSGARRCESPSKTTSEARGGYATVAGGRNTSRASSAGKGST